MNTITINSIDGLWDVSPDVELKNWYDDERSDYLDDYLDIEHDCE